MRAMPLLAELIGESPGIIAVRAKVAQLLDHHQESPRRLPPVLLQGETGTGKGLLARLIHREGPRCQGPFIDVNCAAIPETLLEAELFGFERGAFTDASHAKPGLFQTAHRGILFLDEIGLLPAALQPKLLKFIEEQAVRRLGSTRSEHVDVWILAASNEVLSAQVAASNFRRDLYHRLAVVTIALPPLREHREDITLLAEHFLARACADHGLPLRTLSAEARTALLGYDWPGNVRELSNILERAALLADVPTITSAALGVPSTPIAQRASADPALREALGFDDSVTSLERERLLDALRATSWNITRAADRLRISRARLRYRIEKYDLRPKTNRARQHTGGRHSPAAAFAPATTPPLESAPLWPLHWEHRHISVLRVDLLFEAQPAVPPEASRAMELIIEKVRSFGGRVQELGPRTLVAAFGLESAEDAPSRAAMAAMAIQKATARAFAWSGTRIKLAVHVARPMVGLLGGTPQIDPDGMADAAMTVKALIALGAADTIVASEAAVPFLERRFELVRGDRPAGAPELYCIVRREPTGFGLGGRALSPFVGRDQELLILRDRLAQVERGHGHVVGVLGEPGVGKSRLIYEFTRSMHFRPWRILAGRAVSYGRNTPYLPLVDLLKQYFQIEDGEAPTRIRERVTEKIFGLDSALQPHVPALVSLLDGDVENQQWQSLEPVQRREQTLEAIKWLLIRESQTQPLGFVLEDLHWIDTETQVAIDRLIDSLPTARILLLVTYRPEYQFGWESKTSSTEIRLVPLEPKRTDELVTTLLGEDPQLSALKRLLIERTEGNPFFLEESVRALVESKTLVGERGAYSLAKSVGVIQAPATVRAVLAARMDQLPAEEAALLQTASVTGAQVPFALLRAIAEIPDDRLRCSLKHLQAAEFLYERTLFPSPEYTFKHALTHEVAYERLLPERRRVLHRRIVEAIERLYADRLAEHVELLAHHSLGGEIWDKASLYCQQAGMKAAGHSASRAAVTHFEQALVALEHLPESRDRVEQAIDVRFELRRAFAALGEYADIMQHLREAESLAQGLGDRRRLGWALNYMPSCRNWMGDPSGAFDCGQQALALAADLTDAGVQGVTYILGMVHYALGEYPQARALFTDAVLRVHGDNLFERFGQAALPAVFSRAGLVRCLAQLGDFASGVECGEEAVQIAESADQPFSLVLGCLGLGSVYLLKGDLPEAIPVLERAVGLCRRWTIPAWFPAAASSLGYAYVLSGRLGDGMPLLHEAIDEAARMRIGYDEAPTAAWLSEAYLLDGGRDEAVSLAQRELDRSRDCGHRGHEAYGLRVFAEIAAHLDPHDVETARDYYHQALALATELGMRPLVAHCHRGLGELYRRTGKNEQAQERLTTAATMYLEMGMTTVA